jgi:hypothetical protein
MQLKQMQANKSVVACRSPGGTAQLSIEIAIHRPIAARFHRHHANALQPIASVGNQIGLIQHLFDDDNVPDAGSPQRISARGNASNATR